MFSQVCPQVQPETERVSPAVSGLSRESERSGGSHLQAPAPSLSQGASQVLHSLTMITPVCKFHYEVLYPFPSSPWLPYTPPIVTLYHLFRRQNRRGLHSLSQERRKDRDDEVDDCDDYTNDKFESESDKSPSETGTYTVDKDDQTTSPPSLQVRFDGHMIIFSTLFCSRSRDCPACPAIRQAMWRSGQLNTPSQSPGTCHCSSYSLALHANTVCLLLDEFLGNLKNSDNFPSVRPSVSLTRLVLLTGPSRVWTATSRGDSCQPRPSQTAGLATPSSSLRPQSRAALWHLQTSRSPRTSPAMWVIPSIWWRWWRRE